MPVLVGILEFARRATVGHAGRCLYSRPGAGIRLVEFTAVIQEDTFPRSWECSRLREMPSPLPNDVHYYPGGDSNFHGDGLWLRITGKSGREWIGVFAFGGMSPFGLTGVYTHPNPDMICVLSKGIAYFVSSNDPASGYESGMDPILLACPVPEAGILAFANHNWLEGHGVTGHAWNSCGVAWDGMKDLKAEGSRIIGWSQQPWDDAWARFEIDARTGRCLVLPSGL